MSKRRKFVLTSLALALGLLAIANLVDLTARYLAVGLLSIMAICLSLWSLREGLRGISWLMTPILPSLLTLGVGLFYFLLPGSPWVSIAVTFAFAFSVYALLLTENIFAVAAIRTIALVRAASSVGFLLTLACAFFLNDVILSFRLPFWINGLLVFFASLPLFFQSLWSVNLEEKISSRLILYSAFLSFCLAEAGIVISFWPVPVALGSLFLATTFYVLLGLAQAQFQERLFQRTVREYLVVGIGVLITLALTTRWGG